jgi:hypothetical protein
MVRKEAIVALARYYTGIFLEILSKTNKYLRILCVLAEIRTEYVPNTGLECYHYTGLIGSEEMR